MTVHESMISYVFDALDAFDTELDVDDFGIVDELLCETEEQQIDYGIN